jgi:hypothetical protein
MSKDSFDGEFVQENPGFVCDDFFARWMPRSCSQQIKIRKRASRQSHSGGFRPWPIRRYILTVAQKNGARLFRAPIDSDD